MPLSAAAWANIIAALGAGASAYGAKTAADSSKFQNKPIDLTPQEDWLFKEQQRNYYNSPQRDYIGGLTSQFLKNTYGQGVPGAGGFVPSFQTDRFKGMQLPGGPGIDFSGLPEKPWNPTPRPGGAPGAGGSGGQGAGQFGSPAQPNSPIPPDFQTRKNPQEIDSLSGLPPLGPGGGSTGSPGGADPQLFAKAKSWLDAHPREAATAMGAINGLVAAGVPGAVAYGIYQWWKNRGANPTQLPGNTAQLPPGSGVVGP